jgi:DNA-binding winged helix-turn-helix (wHTH) protein
MERVEADDKRGELTREELRKCLWPADMFVDFEHGLNGAVKRLRDVLGDSADAPAVIETIPRRGYRFVAPVLPVAAPAAALLEIPNATADAAASQESRQAPNRRSIAVAA